MLFFRKKDPLDCLDTHISYHKQNFIIRSIRSLINYLLLTWAVFIVLLLGANFSAYSQILMNYIDPESAERSGKEITTLIDASNMQVYAGNDVAPPVERKEQLIEEKKQNLDLVKEQLKEIDPKIANDTSYDPIRLSHGIDSVQDQVSFDLVPYDNRIIIPKLGKNIPLVDVRVDAGFDLDHMDNIFMRELEKWVLRYPGTAVPWQAGNTFIFWHSSNYPWLKGEFNDVFALINKLKSGDEIIIYYDQKKYIYRVKEQTVVKPWNVKALQSRDPSKKELSLMTCWPVGTTLNRLIVFAELQE